MLTDLIELKPLRGDADRYPSDLFEQKGQFYNALHSQAETAGALADYLGEQGIAVVGNDVVHMDKSGGVLLNLTVPHIFLNPFCLL